MLYSAGLAYGRTWMPSSTPGSLWRNTPCRIGDPHHSSEGKNPTRKRECNRPNWEVLNRSQPFKVMRMRVCTLSVAGMAQSLDLSSRGPGTWNLAKERNEGVRNPADLTESRKPFLTEDLHSWSRSSWGLFVGNPKTDARCRRRLIPCFGPAHSGCPRHVFRPHHFDRSTPGFRRSALRS